MKRTAKRAPKRRAKTRKTSPKPKARAKAAPRSRREARPAKPLPNLNRVRRTLDEGVPTPPSSLNMDRRGTAARSGRAELSDNLRKHGAGMSPRVTGGDVDADFENAYFSGDEAPGGDNPTPDQDVVDDIGRALGVEYEDNEPLKGANKLSERDRHRWELDPASAEDYKDRD